MKSYIMYDDLRNNNHHKLYIATLVSQSDKSNILSSESQEYNQLILYGDNS